MRIRRVVVTVVAVVAVVVLGFVVAGYKGTGPLATRLGVTVTHVQPTGIGDPAALGDPLGLTVLFPWPHDGFCSGQFSVSVQESDREVRVGEVTSVEYASGSCAGVGARDGRAGVTAALRAPVGDRAVVRASDGAPLPVVTP